MKREGSKFEVRSPKGRAALVSVSALAGLVAVVAAQQLPRFRAGVDVVEMDVSVLDKDHKPVRGLKAEDFTILEDGVPQKIVAFSEEAEQPPPPPSAPWIRDVPKDVQSNQIDDKHLFVIILDDAEMGKPAIQPRGGLRIPGRVDSYEIDTMRKVGKRAVELLGDGDLAAVVFANDNFKGQTFTADRSLLLRAVDSLTVAPDYRVDPSGIATDCQMVWYPTAALRSAVDALSAVPHRRKTIIFVSIGSAIPIIGKPPEAYSLCADKAQDAVLEAFAYAQRANVNIYTLDPGGLRVQVQQLRLDFLTALAENTGGRAVINTNDTVNRVADLIAETRSYYILGYELGNRKSDGKFHRVEVRVNRRDVEVHSRTMRYDGDPPKSTGADKLADPTANAVGEFLPKSDLWAEAAVAAFPSLPNGHVVVSVAGRLPAVANPPTRDHIDVLVRAFTPDGRAAGTRQEMKQVVLESGEATVSAAGGVGAGPRFEVSSQLDLPPGRYSLRIAVHSAAVDKTGSVYTDVLVPDFAKEPLSMPGLILTASTGSSGRGDVLASLIPTADRTFTTDDRIQAFMRIYQGGSNPPANVTMHVKIVDEHNAAVSDRTEAIPAGAFARDRQADYFVRLPLATFKPGEYWLAIEASSGKLTARRDLRFAVK